MLPALGPMRFLKSFHVSKRLGVIYVNNPKVACSSIKLTLQRAELDDPDYQPAKSVHEHQGSPLVTWPDLTKPEIETLLKSTFVFTFVRNPFERLRSAYFNKIVHPQKKGMHRMRAGFERRELPSFEAFILSITAMDVMEHDVHWRPQVINLSVNKITYDFIGKLESFAPDWARLVEKSGLPASVSRAGMVTPNTTKRDLEFSPEMEARVAEIYAADFETFGYAPNLMS